MMITAKIAITAFIIAFCSWLSGKRPELAGFITALPVTTLIVLIFSHLEWQDENTIRQFSKSIFVGLPLSTSFFIPFLLAKKFDLSFWTCYGSGIVLLILAYFVHRLIIGWL